MPKLVTIHLKDYGFKETPARLYILSFLEKAKGPIDVTQIMTFLKEQRISVDKVTVYRILDAFCDKGLVTRLELQEGKFRYELNLSDHHHFICEECGEITEIPGCPVYELENDIAKKQKVVIKKHSLEFFGVCHHCQNV